MRLAAKLTTVRGAERRPLLLRGTLRDQDALPRDVVVLDLSATGFRIEPVAGLRLDPGTRVRIAATPLGVHEAVLVRDGPSGPGFAFARTLDAATVAMIDAGGQPSTVVPFPAPPPASATVAHPTMPALDRAPSARLSLVLMVAISCSLWMVLAGLVAAATLLR